MSICCGIAAAVFVAAPARATPSARLIYGRAAGGESCPDEPAVRSAVSARIGYDPFFPYATKTVVLTISGNDEKLTARIELIENEHVNARELSMRKGACDELIESAALAIAIAIDPRALTGPAPPPPAEAPAPPSPSPPVEAEVTAPAAAERPAAPTSPALRWRAQLGSRIAVGLEPGAAVGLAAGGAVIFSHASLGAEVESFLPTTTTAASGSIARVWLVDGAVVPCWRSLPLSVCGVGRIGRLEGTGDHVVDPRTDASVFVALGARAGVEVALAARVFFHFDGEIDGTLVRPTLESGPETLWRAPAANGMLAASLSYDFE
jgi:hypothetical protein